MTPHQLFDKIGDLDEKSILVFGLRQSEFLIREVSRIFNLNGSTGLVAFHQQRFGLFEIGHGANGNLQVAGTEMAG